MRDISIVTDWMVYKPYIYSYYSNHVWCGPELGVSAQGQHLGTKRAALFGVSLCMCIHYICELCVYICMYIYIYMYIYIIENNILYVLMCNRIIIE